MCRMGNTWALAPYCNGLVGRFLTPVNLENMYSTLFEMCHKNSLHTFVPCVCHLRGVETTLLWHCHMYCARLCDKFKNKILIYMKVHIDHATGV
jgi:hypothetical protein